MTTSSKKEYDQALNALQIPKNKNPFPLESPKEVDYWADNKDVLEKIIKAQVDSILFTSSLMYIFYGPLGGGKTFAIHYLANPKTKQAIVEGLGVDNKIVNIHVSAVAPKRTGQLTFSLHKDIVEKCFSYIEKNQELLEIFAESPEIGTGKIKTAFEDIRKSITRQLIGEIKLLDLNNREGYKMLTQTRSRLGKLEDINDLVESIRILVGILSEKYRRIIISIDELENLARATGTERVLCSDFIRKLHGMIENHLTLFMIFTLDSYEEAKQVLQPAAISRVKDAIEFTYVKKKADVIEYIQQCISFRSNVKTNDVIDSETIDAIADSLITNFRNRLSFRAINREMNNVFSTTYMFAGCPEKFRITFDLYKSAMMKASAEEIVDHLREKMMKK